MAQETKFARQVRLLSTRRWGRKRAVTLLGTHPVFRQAQEQLQRFAAVDRPVVLMGESGTGKEEFARSLYLLSDRVHHPFFRANCAHYLNEQTLVSELFGHAKGSFTGASREHKGLFQRADGGILFLDEVGELTLSAQSLLLRAIGAGEVTPMGMTRPRPVDVRIVAATNRDLRQMVQHGTFRHDLYHRLCQLDLHIPPLRERGDDLRVIAEHYLSRLNVENRSSVSFDDATLSRFARYPWPGNVRELMAVIDFGYCMGLASSIIRPEDVRPKLEAPTPVSHPAESHPLESPRVESPRVESPNGKWRHEAVNGGIAGAPTASGSLATDPDPGNDGFPECPICASVNATLRDVVEGAQTFWQAVREPFLARELNRQQVRCLVRRGLEATDGSLSALRAYFNVPTDEYRKFVDFLRYHDLKPVSSVRSSSPTPPGATSDGTRRDVNGSTSPRS